MQEPQPPLYCARAAADPQLSEELTAFLRTYARIDNLIIAAYGQSTYRDGARVCLIQSIIMVPVNGQAAEV